MKTFDEIKEQILTDVGISPNLEQLDSEVSKLQKSQMEKAMKIAVKYGGIDGEHHKAWVIDQMIRSLTGCPLVEKTALDHKGESYSFMGMGESPEYLELVEEACNGEDGPETYDWDIGITP